MRDDSPESKAYEIDIVKIFLNGDGVRSKLETMGFARDHRVRKAFDNKEEWTSNWLNVMNLMLECVGDNTD